MAASTSDPTLTAALARRLAEDAGGEFCKLIDAEGEAHSVSFGALMARAMAWAERFGPRDAADPERHIAAVCVYHSLDLHAAFIGALWAGHIPTMIAPPSPRMEPAKYARSFAGMLEHIKPRWAVVDAATHRKLEEAELGDFAGVEVLDPEATAQSAELPPYPADPDEVAVLQHSSGTTSLQKGIALSHRAIIAHNVAYAEALGLADDDVIVSWLPLYHDMGFVACFLLPLVTRVPLVEISPFDWVTKPALLLEQIHRHQGTRCWLPNFAYAFMARSVRPGHLSDGLDLSSVRSFVNCSEPVYDASHRVFLERFSDFGVHEGQLTQSYAMAETVYAVTQSQPGAYRVLRVDREIFAREHRAAPSEAEDAFSFVSNGPAMPTMQVAILDDADAPLAAGQVGQIALKATHLFSGYFRRDDLTQAAMTADGWYRTGDLGFVHEGEVYVTGRRKDLIIIQGRNFYPTDIEAAAGRVEGINPGRVVAFGLSDEATGTEKLVVLAEPAKGNDEDPRRLALKLRQTIAQQLDCTPGDVRVVPERWLVKSTSGKLARGDNRAKYLGEFGGRIALRGQEHPDAE